ALALAGHDVAGDTLPGHLVRHLEPSVRRLWAVPGVGARRRELWSVGAFARSNGEARRAAWAGSAH
ncbi:MAG: hypothetical protein JWO62_1586, partial [Acidimicrobiaceae bacterium]|nr:hypothetical protein [Acidimicrobiaceae bacterium]